MSYFHTKWYLIITSLIYFIEYSLLYHIIKTVSKYIHWFEFISHNCFVSYRKAVLCQTIPRLNFDSYYIVHIIIHYHMITFYSTSFYCKLYKLWFNIILIIIKKPITSILQVWLRKHQGLFLFLASLIRYLIYIYMVCQIFTKMS